MSSGSSRAKPVDIIDLDRYMRVSVMPSRPNYHVQRCGDLVVDAGGVRGLPTVRSSSDDGSYSPLPAYHKRFSHDSGVSDGSYAKRRSRRYKHCAESNHPKQERGQRNECSSVIPDFRLKCEQALLEQQKQISRLAELCERLREVGLHSPRCQKSREHCSKEVYSTAKKLNKKLKQVDVKHIATDSSDTSSSSRSSRDVKLKEHRTDSCKTYKIMMERLDDLSRVLTNRQNKTFAPPSTVLVCNKVVATEPEKFEKINSPMRNIAVRGRRDECGTSNSGKSGEKHDLGITHAQTLNIAPVLINRTNVLTERVVCSSSSSVDLRFQYHLNDPIRFHEEAKHLQALHARQYQSHHHHTAPDTAAETAPAAAATSSPHDTSLCALCRTYWRAIRNRLSHTFGTYS